MSAIAVAGTPIEWYLDGDTWRSRPLVFSGELTVTEDEIDTSRFAWEKQKFSSSVMALSVDQAWREANGEDVGSGEGYVESDDNDRPCALLLHPLDVASLHEHPHDLWGTFLTVSHEGNKGVVKPSGVSRPANWVGSGGLTPDGGNNDLWYVAGGSSAPKATLTVAERYTGRMTRMFDHAADLPPPDDGFRYHAEFGFIYNRANPPESVEELLDPEEDRVPENLWHWKNFSAGRLDITAPKAGTVTLRVAYKEPVFDFPYTTNAGYNWGPDSPSSLTWEYHTATWQVAVAEGVNEVAFDLALPKTGPFDPQLHVVTSIAVELPAASGNEQWTLSEITLLPHDPNALEKQEGEFDHRIWSHYDPRQWAADFTGFRGVLSGKRILAIPYGMEDRETVERALKIRQKREGYPSGLIFDYAKALSTTGGELSWQEGLTATYGDPEESVHNKDADDNYLVSLFRTFDLRHAHEFQGDGSVGLTGGPKVVSISIPYGLCGLEDDTEDLGVLVVYDKYPQGRYHGLAFKSDRSGRKRREGNLYLWKRPLAGGTWVLASETPAVPDRFGRWRLGPDKEKGWYYGVSDYSDQAPTAGSEFRNREYVWRTITIPSGDKYVCCFHQIPNFLYVFYTDGGLKHIYNAPPDRWWRNPTKSQAHYALPRIDTDQDDSCPSGYVDTNGRIRLFFVRGGALYRGTSPNWGLTWEGGAPVATAITSAEAAFQWLSEDRTREFSVRVQDGSFIFSYSHDHFTTLDGSSTITTGADASQVSGYDRAGILYAYCFKGGALYCFKMLQNGAWVEV